MRSEAAGTGSKARLNRAGSFRVTQTTQRLDRSLSVSTNVRLSTELQSCTKNLPVFSAVVSQGSVQYVGHGNTAQHARYPRQKRDPRCFSTGYS